MAEPMPDIDVLFARLSGHKYFSRLDLSKGYWQVPLSQAARPMTAFQTPMGLFQLTKRLFGINYSSSDIFGTSGVRMFGS